jgi:hypothetical protein
MTALVTGTSPFTTGAFHDASYDRSHSPPGKEARVYDLA